jgi:hypothetical protein
MKMTSERAVLQTGKHYDLCGISDDVRSKFFALPNMTGHFQLYLLMVLSCFIL